MTQLTKSSSLAVTCFATASLLGAAAETQAATLVEGEFQVMGDVNAEAADNPGISVTPGSEGYSTGTDGLGTGGLDGSFNAPILDYAFYKTGSGSLVESLGGAAPLIGPAVNSGGTSSDVTTLDIWATTTPNATLSNPDQNTWARPQDVTGTVDISTLSSGSLYMFFGTRIVPDNYDITFTLSGVGQPDVSLSELGILNTDQGGISNNTWFVYRADFADAADYDTLTFTYDAAHTNNAAQSRFGGVVLTAEIPSVVPEPSSLALLGLGGLALMARRRRTRD